MDQELNNRYFSVTWTNCGMAGKKQNKVKSTVIAWLEPKFGLPKHFVISEGESEDGTEKIQESFVSLAKSTNRFRDQCLA